MNSSSSLVPASQSLLFGGLIRNAFRTDGEKSGAADRALAKLFQKFAYFNVELKWAYRFTASEFMSFWSAANFDISGSTPRANL
jgi:hypothetical protein